MTKLRTLRISNPTDEDIAIAFGAVKLAWARSLHLSWTGTLTLHLMPDFTDAPIAFREWLSKHEANHSRKVTEIKHAREGI